MIVTYEMMVKKLKEYFNYMNPKTKIGRMVKNKEIIRLNKGYYEDGEPMDPFYYADIFYGPSYISFETALSFYQLIPERTYKVSCATKMKGKRKDYVNQISEYLYSDVPAGVFDYGVKKIERDGYCYHIASPEKALLDTLYSLKPVKNQEDMKELIEDDMRIDTFEFKKFDKELIRKITPLYHCRNVDLFTKIFEKGGFSY